MFTRKSLVFLTVAAALLTMLVPAANAQGPNPYAEIKVTGVTSGVAAVGSVFTTDMVFSINRTGAGMTAAEVYLGYLQHAVDPVDTNSTLAGVQPAELQAGFFGVLPIASINEVRTPCPITEFSSCIHLVVAGPPQNTKTGVVARLHWRGKAGASPAVFAILKPVMAGVPEPDPPRTAFFDADGFIIPLNTAIATDVIIQPGGTIRGKVLRQGVPPTTGPGTHACTRIDATTGTINAGPVLTDAGGNFSLPITSAGRYIVTAWYPGYLKAQKPDVDVPPDMDIGPTKLFGGDVNGDGVINMGDIMIIINPSNFDQTGRPVRSDPPDCNDADDSIDINDDGNVNISDLAIAVGNCCLMSGPRPWAP